MNQTTGLYRFYGADGVLLYVGITHHLPNRLIQHGKAKPWWTDIVGMTVEWHDTRAAALQAEQTAIVNEHPVHNIMHNRPARADRRVAQLTWLCDHCGQPINDGDGYLENLYQHIQDRSATPPHTVEEHVAELKRTMLHGDDIKAYKPSTTAVRTHLEFWHITHRRCDPNPSRASYWISVDRLRTAADITRWSAHLHEKAWVEYTDWDAIETAAYARLSGTPT